MGARYRAFTRNVWQEWSRLAISITMDSTRDDIFLQKIISGGQTGVDRGALDAAIALGIEHGGSCPRGRIAEDGYVPARFQLTELASPKYAVRTEQNVLDSDGTLIFYNGRLTAGTGLTQRVAMKHHKPVYLYDLTRPDPLEDVVGWLIDNHISTLNCAGPRESSARGIESITCGLCKELFALVMNTPGPWS